MNEFIYFHQIFSELKNLRDYYLNYLRNYYLQKALIFLFVIILVFLFYYPSANPDDLLNLLILFLLFYFVVILTFLSFTLNEFLENWRREFKKTLLRHIFEEIKNEKKIIINYYYKVDNYNKDFYKEVINMISFAKEAIIKRLFINEIKRLIIEKVEEDINIKSLLVFNLNDKTVYFVEGAVIQILFYRWGPGDWWYLDYEIKFEGILIICELDFKSELLAVFYNTNDTSSYDDIYNKGKYIKSKYSKVEVFTLNPTSKFFEDEDKAEVLVDKLIKNYYFQNKFYGSFFVIKDNKLINFLSYKDLALVDIDGLFFVPSLLASDKILKKAVIHTYVQLNKRINFINEIIKIIGSGLEEETK
jgi:hypothetical protein